VICFKKIRMDRALCFPIDAGLCGTRGSLRAVPLNELVAEVELCTRANKSGRCI